MIVVKKPFYWVSAHRPVEFTLDYPLVFPIDYVVGNNGFAVFIFTGDGINSLTVGQYLYCNSGIYKGFHKVSEILFSNWYKTETVFTVTQLGGELTFIQDEVFTIYSGYDSGDLSPLLPSTLIATFKPEPNIDGQLVVNISGYINKIFDVINSFDTALVGPDKIFYNTFNKVRVFINGVFLSEHMVLNSAITSLELNDMYVDTGRELNGGNLGNHYLSCGTSYQMMIIGGYVVLSSLYIDGVNELAPEVFDPTDFSVKDFVTG